MSSRILILLSLTAFVTVCATTGEKPHPKARIDVQEQVGFTITEPVSVSDGRLLTDEAAPLEPLVRPTAEYLRHQARDYLPVNVLYY